MGSGPVSYRAAGGAHRFNSVPSTARFPEAPGTTPKPLAATESSM